MCLPQVWLFVATLANAACFADEEESDAGVSSKENRQQAGNVESRQPHPTGHTRLSAGAAQSKRLSTKVASSKTCKSNRLSGTSTNSHIQSAEHDSSAPVSAHSARQDSVLIARARLTQASPAAASATHDLDAQSAGSESIGLQSSVPGEPVSQEVPAAVTPVKASLAKSSGD